MCYQKRGSNAELNFPMEPIVKDSDTISLKQAYKQSKNKQQSNEVKTQAGEAGSFGLSSLLHKIRYNSPVSCTRGSKI